MRTTARIGLAVSIALCAAHPARSGAQETRPAEPSTNNVTKALFGKTAAGVPVDVYTLTNGHLTAKIITYGGIITELHVPDRDGKDADVVLGFDDLAVYEKGRPFCALVGHYANRIANAKFTVDGHDYELEKNSGPNTIHGGSNGFDKTIWDATPLPGDEPAVKLTHIFPDGDQHFPGNLSVSVVYSLTKDNGLKLDYTATTDKPTAINFTNHAYFNVRGAGNGEVLDQQLYFAASRYTPGDERNIPNGELKPVAGTAFDFTKPTEIGAHLAETGKPVGYDQNFVLDNNTGKFALAARVFDPQTGRTMETWTTEPGLQFLTANFNNTPGKHGTTYSKHASICLETQHYPDSVHHPDWPTTFLRPGETYRQTTEYRFSTK